MNTCPLSDIQNSFSSELSFIKSLNHHFTSKEVITNSFIKKFSNFSVKLKTNTKRGYDHGVFIPLMIMYPEIKVPVVQISILESLDPEDHFKMGVALRTLKN
jgi:aromatic ring-opening dioxygenase catalytic subunit (LigB family)